MAERQRELGNFRVARAEPGQINDGRMRDVVTGRALELAHDSELPAVVEVPSFSGLTVLPGGRVGAG